MKKTILLISVLVLLLVVGIIAQTDFNSQQPTKDIDNTQLNGDEINKDKDNAELNGYQISLFDIDGEPMIYLDDISDKYNLTWHYDSLEGIIEIRDEDNVYRLLKDKSLISKNGVYNPNTYKPYIDSSEKIYLPIKMLNFFDLSYDFRDTEHAIVVFNDSNSDYNTKTEFLEFEKNFANMNEEALASYLSFLSVPLEGAHISNRDSQLPGAPRTYRNGTHEGIDWYAGYVGINVNRNTPVLSMAEGVVVRADHDYVELTSEEREQILKLSADAGHTPEIILDKLRGQSIWVQYPKGVLVRYVHLSRIEDGIMVGKSVKTGEVLGYVGNSGTSYGVEGNDVGLHLHSDILIYDHLFWDHLDQNQIRRVLERIFPSKND